MSIFHHVVRTCFTLKYSHFKLLKHPFYVTKMSEKNSLNREVRSLEVSPHRDCNGAESGSLRNPFAKLPQDFTAHPRRHWSICNRFSVENWLRNLHGQPLTPHPGNITACWTMKPLKDARVSVFTTISQEKGLILQQRAVFIVASDLMWVTTTLWGLFLNHSL